MGQQQPIVLELLDEELLDEELLEDELLELEDELELLELDDELESLMLDEDEELLELGLTPLDELDEDISVPLELLDDELLMKCSSEYELVQGNTSAL